MFEHTLKRIGKIGGNITAHRSDGHEMSHGLRGAAVTTRRESTSLYESIPVWYSRLVRAPPEALTCYRSTRTTRLAAESSNRSNRGRIARSMARKLPRNWAARLTREFGSGFSKTNLEYMRRSYLAYPGRTPQIGQTASGQFPAFAITQTLSGQLQGVHRSPVLPGLVPLRIPDRSKGRGARLLRD